MRIFVTGLTGFAGSHLAEFLLEKPGVKIFGVQRHSANKENLSSLSKKVSLFDCDVQDGARVRKILKDIKPDRIFHLAAHSSVPASWKSPGYTLMTNIMGELNILEAVRSLGITPRIHIAASSEEYGLVLKGEIPLKETAPLRPLSPYAVSKITQDLLGYQYYKTFGLHVVRTRAFSHTGPRQKEDFVASNFARQVALIEARRAKPIIHVGNLEAVRDFLDVRDVVKAYWLALEKGSAGEVYNVCSGRRRKIREILDFFVRESRVKIKVKKDPQRMRPSDVPFIVGDASKLKKEVKWKPEISFQKTLLDLLSYWRGKVRDQ